MFLTSCPGCISSSISISRNLSFNFFISYQKNYVSSSCSFDTGCEMEFIMLAPEQDVFIFFTHTNARIAIVNNFFNNSIDSPVYCQYSIYFHCIFRKISSELFSFLGYCELQCLTISYRIKW